MNESRPIVPVRLPSVDQVLRSPVAAAAIARFGRAATTDAVTGGPRDLAFGALQIDERSR